MRQVGFVGPSYTLRSVNVDCQSCINLYPEVDELGTTKNGEVGALVSTPGLLKLSTAGAGPVRGMHVAANGRAFCVSANGLYEITDPTAPVLLGSGATFSGAVSMADNGQHLVMVDGDKMYIYEFSTGIIGTVATPGFSGATRIAFQDGYFIANRPGTFQFFISALWDGSSWDALDVGSKEGMPDNILSLLVDHRELWLFGKYSTEVWFNSGDALFPFSRIQGAFLEHGIAAPFAVSKLDNSLFWWAQDANGNSMAYRAEGYSPRRLSTHAVEFAVSGYGDISGATSYTYQSGGHSFWITNFPGANTTWCFDVATGLWHERNYTNANGGYSRHRAECHAVIGQRHVVGDYANGNLYELSETTYTDNGTAIARIRRVPHASNEMKRIAFRMVGVDMETGVGLATGQGSDPKISLRWSDDGGHTWSNEHLATMGKIGEFRKRAIWRRLGVSRDRVFELKVTDPVPVTLISGFGELEYLAS